LRSCASWFFTENEYVGDVGDVIVARGDVWVEVLTSTFVQVPGNVGVPVGSAAFCPKIESVELAFPLANASVVAQAPVQAPKIPSLAEHTCPSKNT
jgi:hypothetical protein